MEPHEGSPSGSQDPAASALSLVGPTVLPRRSGPPEEEPGSLSVLDVHSVADFTEAYDQRVDQVEAELVNEALDSLQSLDLDRAGDRLSLAVRVREHYLGLLEDVSSQAAHPLLEHLGDLREFAVAHQRLSEYLNAIVEALRIYRTGHAKKALMVLDGLSSGASEVEEFESLLAGQVGLASETITAMIRRGALDHAGARAAYDRVVVAADLMLEMLSEADSSEADEDDARDAGDATAGQEVIEALSFQRLMGRACSLHMQHLQLTGARELVAASAAAGAASRAYVEAAELIGPHAPAMGPMVRAMAHEAEALALASDAELAVDEGDWDRASTTAEQVREAYNSASRTCLASPAPGATMVQERYLNAAFEWGASFRHRLERERRHARRLQKAEAELQSLYVSLQSALGAGVVVNNVSEIAQSVHQQVEITNHIEQNVRNLLRDAPEAIALLPVSEDERDDLVREANELATANETGPGFMNRAGRFARKFAAATRGAAELAPPVLKLLAALATIV